MASNSIVSSSGENDNTYVRAVEGVTASVKVAANTITGTSGDDFLWGTTGKDVINGLGGNDVLYGGGGGDTLAGGDGNDTYIVDTASNVSGFTISETASGGTDTVIALTSFTLPDNVENMTLAIGAGSINGTGNGLNNIIIGNEGNNLIDGGAGADAMTGGDGNDTYVVDNTGDTITEAVTGGTDTVQSYVDFSLASVANVENLTLLGTAVNGTGNSGVNTIIGNDSGNNLDGGGGADILAGGKGDDTYVVNNTGVTVKETANQGTDLVQSSVSFTLPDNVENLTLTQAGNITGTGNVLSNVITGNGGNNFIDPGANADFMAGGAGNDTYIVDNNTTKVVLGGVTYTGDQVTENLSAGNDLVKSSVTFTLPSNVENLVLTGSQASNGTGNGLSNVLVGNDSPNQIDGGSGADLMIGGKGDDTYIVDDNSSVATVIGTAADGSTITATITGDTISELASGGTDLVNSSVSYSLSANLENLTLTGAGDINGTGNTGANTITGNSGNNVLDGGGVTSGLDTLIGGNGNDTYIVDNTGVTIVETNSVAATGGTDLVESSISFSLASIPNVENLMLTGAAANATGSSLNNVIVGNSSANQLDGGSGADLLIGGNGNDTYIVDNNSSVAVVTGTAADGSAILATITGDTISEAATGGTDLIQSSVTYSLPANVENLTLTGTVAINGTGNGDNNVLIGNSASNILDGGSGADSMSGGAGNDTYVVDNTGDTITEAANAGTDTVSVTGSFNYSIAGNANLENITLSGSANNNATGNAGNNVLIGGSGNNLLDGGSGADSMAGGAGNDTYVVDNIGDTVTEGLTAGTDLVQSSVSFTLPANVENLTLTNAAGNLSGTGNGLDNIILGDGGNNTLSGGAGNDTLSGGAGNDYLDGGSGADLMIGGLGNDTYIVDDNSTVAVVNGGSATITGDTISEAANAGIDVVLSSVSYGLGTGSNIEKLTLTGTANINGTGNELNNTLVGNSGDNQLSGGSGADSMSGGLGNDTYIVDNTGDTVTELAAQGTDLVQSSVSFSLAGTSTVGVENLTLTGSANTNATGNDLANTLNGNTGNNILDGRGGADLMIGGDGNDTYVVDNNSTVAVIGGTTYTGDTVSESSSSGGTDLVQSSVTYSLPANVENLTLTGNGVINGTGNGLDNSILGNSAKNVIDGGAGNDTITGGGGVDTLTGGAGNDTFVYTNASDTGLNVGNRDIITDFASGQDKIDISQLDADPTSATIDHWTFVTGFSASGQGEVMFTAATATTPALVQFDYGDGTADFQIELTQVGNTPQALTASDFILS